jgi:flagellar protein FlbD
MIELTRLNNRTLTLNADLIKYVEQSPDTVITLVTGEKLVVRERAEEVVKRVISFRRTLLAELYRGPLAETGSTTNNENPENCSG